MSRAAAKKKSEKVVRIKSVGMDLRQIKPMNYSQEQVFELFFENNLLLSGCPGTGKTFLILYLALREIIEFNRYRKIVIVRSAVQTRDMGFMPGTLEEKMSVYEAPYRDIVNNLCGRGDAYDILKNKGLIEFMSTSYVRGLTIDRTVIIVDEIQNANFGELSSIATRLGDNSKILFCGDYRQTDLKNEKEKQGMRDFVRVLEKIGTSRVEFKSADIVRSGWVRKFIEACEDLNL
jgi:phosphate starvation-inducible protein PhoH